MDIYLDNNIIVSIENGNFTLREILSVLPPGGVRFYYSVAHLFELENFKGNADISAEMLRANRFCSIRSIFANRYLRLNDKTKAINRTKEDPKIVYDTITSTTIGVPAMKTLMNLISPEQKKATRDQFEIDSIILNNMDSNYALDYLQSKMQAGGKFQLLTELVEHAVSMHSNNKDFGLNNRFAAMFEILDLLGYWRDKDTEFSNYARLWDSSHSFFASCCDYFITDDKRTRYKARLTYEIYKKNTKVVSSKGVS